MPEKQQIMSVSLPVSCETYNCFKKVQWAIGRPDGPRELWNYYCDDCMRDVVSNIPAELLPGSDNTSTDADTFTCEYCGKAFKSNQAVVTHQRFCKAKEDG